MSQMIGGRYVLRDGERVLVADQFDQPVEAVPSPPVAAGGAGATTNPVNDPPAEAGQPEE
ncbi:MAG: hypothetical protein J0H82_04545 [Alphaproteobacteria bacterium]|jgi:hypothetical protein|nr:hypothetical protein [Alphaproteobacteria bacterium]